MNFISKFREYCYRAKLISKIKKSTYYHYNISRLTTEQLEFAVKCVTPPKV
jgi:hypothetical protein